MSILNVNTIQPVGSAQTVTVNATDFKIGSTTLNSSGLVTASAGSTSAPSISPVGDSNTGIFFPASDTVAIGEGGTEVIRVDSGGRVGVGTNRMTRPFEVWAGTAGTSFSVDTVGRVQMPFQPSFFARAGGVTTQAASSTLFNFTREDIDVGGNYNNNSGQSRFTAPISGKYLIGYFLQKRNTGNLQTYIYKNGSEFYRTSYSANTNDGPGDEWVGIIDLVQNDYVQLYYTLDGTGDVYGEASGTWGGTCFWGYLIG